MQSVFASSSKLSGSIRARSKSPEHRLVAPHPIPKGQEGMACPITGMFLQASEANKGMSAVEARMVLEADPDIAAEARELLDAVSKTPTTGDAEAVLTAEVQARSNKTEPVRFVPLNVINRTHKANAETRRLVRSIGGLPTLRRFTTAFYQKAFADEHIDRFIAEHSDPHGERFATWIAEKMGDGTPWTDERRTRPRTQLKIGRQVVDVSFDRSSAHFAAWHSPKREQHKWGEHFKVDDARVWMRLHFWAARETGMFEHEAFMDYYMRFIGHFVSIYSSNSPPFTRESARWSADPQNIQRYLAAGNVMTDVINQPIEKALAQLPANERVYTGSGHHNPSWPYDAPLRG